MTDTVINARVDPQVKRDADELFNKLGITTSAAINMFLRKAILVQGIPFAVSLDSTPNEETIAAMNEFYEMQAHPESYKRYGSFREVLDEVLSDEA